MDVFFLNDVDHISYFVKMPIFPNGRFFLVDHYTVDLFSISGLFFRGRFFRGPYFLNSMGDSDSPVNCQFLLKENRTTAFLCNSLK